MQCLNTSMPEHQYRQQACRATEPQAVGSSPAMGQSNAAMQDRVRRHQHAAQLTS